MRNSVLVLIALVATFAGTPTVRADFTIDVAVDMNNLAPEVSSINVLCEVCSIANYPCNGTTPPSVIAKGSATHSFPPGIPRTFKGNITVVAKSTKTPPVDNSATDYICLLMLNGPSGSSASPSPTSNVPWAKPQPGLFTGQVSGKVPH